MHIPGHMSHEDPGSPAIVMPGQCRVINAYGDELHFHLTATQTAGAFTLFTDITPPGGGPPPHYHVNEDETFCVVEGEAEFFVDGRWIGVPAGCVIHMPRGVRHAFRNPGNRPLRQIIKLSPAGFEDFMAESETEFKRSDSPAVERLATIAARHGIFFDPPLPSQKGIETPEGITA